MKVQYIRKNTYIDVGAAQPWRHDGAIGGKRLKSKVWETCLMIDRALIAKGFVNFPFPNQ